MGVFTIRARNGRTDDQPSGPLRCPYCHDECTSAQAHFACADCLARHHSVCWATHGRCASCSSERRLALESRSALSLDQAVALVVAAFLGFLLLRDLRPGTHLIVFLTVVFPLLGIAGGIVTRTYRWALLLPALVAIALPILQTPFMRYTDAASWIAWGLIAGPISGAVAVLAARHRDPAHKGHAETRQKEAMQTALDKPKAESKLPRGVSTNQDVA
jgi:hypothetical protein